jgi:predicted permease
MSARSVPPRWLMAIGRGLLRLRVRHERRHELEGDLVELWIARAAAGRRSRRRALLRDVLGLLRRPPRPAPAAGDRTQRGAGMRIPASFGLWHDVRHAVRLIRRQPLFATLTVTTLTLGIAGSTTIFTAVDRLLLRPLPYPEPASIVAIENPLFSFEGAGMASHPGMLRAGVLSAAGLYATGGLNLDDSFDPLRVRAAAAEPGLFGALGVAPRIGRVYTADEARDATAPVAIISAGLWRRHFGSRLDILEQTISLNRRRFRITGVMPAGFTFPDSTDVWIPPFADRQLTGDSFAPAVVARLAPGVPIAAAEATLQQFERERGAPADQDPIRLRPLQDELTRTVRPILLVLAVSVALLLLVSCANVAGLLLSRVTSRQSEFVIRRALGGSRWRLGRLLLVESLVLSLAAGAIGAAAAVALLRAIPLLLDQPIPDVELAGVDARLLLVAAGLSTITGAIFGLGPGIAAGARPAADLLRASATASAGRFGRWFRHGLVAGQVGAALVLLVVMGSTVTRLLDLSRVDLGFDGRGTIGLDITLPLAAYAQPRSATDFYDRAAAHLRAVPGVTHVAATGRLPGDRSIGVGLPLKEAGTPAQDRPLFASMLTATPDYFDTLGVRRVAGRAFTADDRAGAPPVVVLSESAAVALWGDARAAVGRSVEVGVRPVSAQVVGVVADVKLHGPEATPREARQLYRPLHQAPPFGTMAFAVRGRLAVDSIAPELRAAIAAADPGLPIARLASIEDVVSQFLSAQRLSMTLMSAFAMVALAMAVIGLYGVLSTLVAQQTREIGIRIALGADRSALRRRVVQAGFRVAAAGVALGALAAGSASALIATFVPSLDPPTWGAIGGCAGVLLAAAIVAAWVPARRASGVDPIQALRVQ